MSNNTYVLLTMSCGTPIPVAICNSDDEYDDYVNTRDIGDIKTLVINRDHPKCPDLTKKIEEHDCTIIDYFEDCPITKEEEETAIGMESEIHSHMLSQLSLLSEEVNKGFIRFSKDELYRISEMIAIFRKHISDCCDEDGCIDIEEQINFKELLKHSRMLAVPFKEVKK